MPKTLSSVIVGGVWFTRPIRGVGWTLECTQICVPLFACRFPIRLAERMTGVYMRLECHSMTIGNKDVEIQDIQFLENFDSIPH